MPKYKAHIISSSILLLLDFNDPVSYKEKLCLIEKDSLPAIGSFAFANTQPNAEKPKEPFFSNEPVDNLTEKSNLDDRKY